MKRGCGAGLLGCGGFMLAGALMLLVIRVEDIEPNISPIIFLVVAVFAALPMGIGLLMRARSRRADLGLTLMIAGGAGFLMCLYWIAMTVDPAARDMMEQMGQPIDAQPVPGLLAAIATTALGWWCWRGRQQ
ncbi:hypothetical protein WJS89_06095 [Sphingomicrobium sp. XHP0235]|uniref:hypothetical protein n=1 Tax=Sphingomicrobium aquimarinum TaxID=3133971 RepID=UPI0031FF2E45